MTQCFELLRARRLRGWTQTQLAERAGVSLKTVNRLERGVAGAPGVDTLRRLAEAMGTPAEQLFPELLGSSESSPAA